MAARTTNGSGSKGASSVEQLAREVSSLQATLLAKLCAEIGGDGHEPFALAAQRLAEEFGSVTATAVTAVCEPASGCPPRPMSTRASSSPGTCAAASTS